VTLTKSAGGVAFVVVALGTFHEAARRCLAQSSSLISLSLPLFSSRQKPGWYLLVGLLFDAGGIPIKLPVGDLSNSFAREEE